jgi:hypothetical protein
MIDLAKLKKGRFRNDPKVAKHIKIGQPFFKRDLKFGNIGYS